MEHLITIGKYTLESLTNGMYASPLDMYREYIQNAVDSLDEAISRGQINRNKMRIDISVNDIDKLVSIRDNGCGIRAEDAVSTLLDIGNSHKSYFTSRGFRGIGRLAGLSYCDKLIFKTSYINEEICSVVEFDAKQLRDLLIPGAVDSTSVEDVLNTVTTVHTEKEKANRSYFEVILENVWFEAGLTDTESILVYLNQHAPLRFSNQFKWGRTVSEKLRIHGFVIPEYPIYLNGVLLTKPYEDYFISDRVKQNTDLIQDICVETFFRGNELSAILWYAQTNYYGTILNNSIKGIRIRQGNILVGDKGSCGHIFKEERFNGWLIGELHIIDKDIIANSRRDGFEKNTAYFELLEKLKQWALSITKTIRHISYERSLPSSKIEIAEARLVEDLNDENSLISEEYMFTDSVSESAFMDQSESQELAETDFFSKLNVLLGQKKMQTKYTALNINERLTQEQRKVLERVFDLITQEFNPDLAEKFVNTISAKF